MPSTRTAEHARLAESLARRADWKQWGPYLAERAWGTVREDYSDPAAGGDPWSHFPHDHARSRAYRWNEDGLGGWCNRHQNLCMAWGLWNGVDPILKERLFGLTNAEGNHGEDVKEYYRYLDGTPTHSYMRMLYKYPQVEYPYAALVRGARDRDRRQREFELMDAIGGALAEGRYFDVEIEYAKVDEADVVCRLTARNRGPDAAPLHVLPQLWFRNTWSWGYDARRPSLRAEDGHVVAAERHLGEMRWYVDGNPGFLFAENDTNSAKLYGVGASGGYHKDAFHDYVIGRRADAVNPSGVGTKAAAHLVATVEPGGSFAATVRLSTRPQIDPFANVDSLITRRRAEADEFYAAIHRPGLTADEKHVQRSSLAGLLWSKQFYHYSVELWKRGDPAGPPPPSARASARNGSWDHFYALDVLSVPDKWEYPWFAAWDTAFHCAALALVDPEWSKRQLILMLREWYMHPNGQLPAYEWDLGDVNPPVHAHAARRVYERSRDAEGVGDTDFLEEVFHKLLLNFTWWVNRKDADGRNAFQGGFLGLDNIGIFDRSNPEGLPDGARLEQADGTAWMALYSLDMLAIALELARTRPAYESTATKFFEHFVAISHAINGICGEIGMWHDEDQFYYDVIRHADDSPPMHLRVASFVGLVPMFGVLALPADVDTKFPDFWRRIQWYLKYRPTLPGHTPLLTEPGPGGSRLLSILDRPKLEAVLRRMLDPAEFLSPHGLRSLSKRHRAEPFTLDGKTIEYEPAESGSPIYGGNSNWRGPVWLPVNSLMVEALREFHKYYGGSLKVDVEGRSLDLRGVADDLSTRLAGLFLRDPATGRRPVFGDDELMQNNELWKDMIPFHEFFHGDDGSGLGASHQTGWTAMVAVLLDRMGMA